MTRLASLLLAAALAPLAGACTALHGSSAADVEREEETVRLYVAGMTCPSRCVREITEMLEPVPGVVGLAFDTPSQTVVCRIVKGTDPESLVQAIKLPYKARVL